MDTIVLIGFMGAGKTTIGKLLSQELALPFIDFDQLLVERLNMSIDAYFKSFGEEAFRKEESKLLHEMRHEPAVLSTGGGIVLQELNRELLQDMQHVIYLQATSDTVYDRIQHDHHAIRPLAKRKKEEFVSLYESRISLYQQVATFTVDTTTRTPMEIVQLIVNGLKEKTT